MSDNLPERDTVYGHELEQIWRKDNVAVFARSLPGKLPHEFEVIIIRHESYPVSEEWGKWGWSLPRRDLAISWGGMVLKNLGASKEARTAWPELFSQFAREVGF